MKIWAALGTLSLSWSGEYPHPLFHGARMWRLIAVSPVDTISFSLLNLLKSLISLMKNATLSTH